MVPGDVSGLPATDHTIRNFRFNPAYRVDVVLFRQILGQVTGRDVREAEAPVGHPPGPRRGPALVYSRALEGARRRASAPTERAAYNLGLELDGTLTYTSGDGFQAWVQWGALQPLGGLEVQGRSPGRAHVIATGLAAKF